jgi:hypothetical protein
MLRSTAVTKTGRYQRITHSSNTISGLVRVILRVERSYEVASRNLV